MDNKTRTQQILLYVLGALSLAAQFLLGARGKAALQFLMTLITNHWDELWEIAGGGSATAPLLKQLDKANKAPGTAHDKDPIDLHLENLERMTRGQFTDEDKAAKAVKEQQGGQPARAKGKSKVDAGAQRK